MARRFATSNSLLYENHLNSWSHFRGAPQKGSDMAAVAEQKQIIKGGAFLIEERTPAEVFTPEDFTEEHRMIAETTRQFVDNEVSPHIDDLEKHDWKLARELIKKAADLGLIGAKIPDEYCGR